MAQGGQPSREPIRVFACSINLLKELQMKITDEMVEKACIAYWAKHVEVQDLEGVESLLPAWPTMPDSIKRVCRTNMRYALEVVIGDKQ